MTKASKEDIASMVKQLNEPPKAPPSPQVTATLNPSGVSISSNIPNVFFAVGVLVAAIFGLLLKNQEKEEPSRIIRLNP